MNDFTSIAPKYRQTATLQRSASERVLDMLAISRTDDVLDLGCGTGHITQAIRMETDGTVVGIDPSEGMIAEARRVFGQDAAFHVGTAESLVMTERFDAICCNSAFQWFRDPPVAVANCFAALRPGGRIAMQAPARADYCPNFLLATESLRHNPTTRETFAHFRSPWFFLETAQGYTDLFTGAGFHVAISEIERITQRCTPTKAFEMFESGAAAGYLNPDCYEGALPPGYVATARDEIARSFQAQAESDGFVALTFFRIYLLAHKP